MSLSSKYRPKTFSEVIGQEKAVGRLIAAAPDLLEALKHLMKYDFGDSEGAKKARAAIEKAEGK